MIKRKMYSTFLVFAPYPSNSLSLFVFHLESRFLREKNIREVPRYRFQRYMGRNLAYVI